MRFLTDTVLNAVDGSVATQTSAAVDCSQWICCSCVVVAVGTLVGAAKFQASNDLLNPTNWVDISQSVAVSGAGNFIIPKFDVAYMWIRVVYTKTSSTATPTVTAIVKSSGF